MSHSIGFKLKVFSILTMHDFIFKRATFDKITLKPIVITCWTTYSIGFLSFAKNKKLNWPN